MSEKLKTLLAVTSLGLFVLAGFGCVCSFLPPTVRFTSDKGKLLIYCIFVEEKNFEYTAGTYSGGERYVLRRMSAWPHIQRGMLGFGYMSGTVSSSPYRIFVVPYWFILAATGPLPLMWLRNRRRLEQRRRAGQCPRCGYDLRATPGKCPECGWARKTVERAVPAGASFPSPGTPGEGWGEGSRG